MFDHTAGNRRCYRSSAMSTIFIYSGSTGAVVVVASAAVLSAVLLVLVCSPVAGAL